MRVVAYLRVSTRDGRQDTENQRLQLQQLCQAQGWEIVREYEDHESGAKSARAEFQAMLRDAATGKFDLLMFWALDRFTREGTLATLKYLELLESYGVRWRSFTEPWIDSAGPFRDVVISLIASIAKQERVRMSERVTAGLERARAKGTRSGRSIGRPRAVFDRSKAIELRSEGWSWGRIARKLGTTVASVRRAYQTFGPTPAAMPKPSGAILHGQP
jgi:DNA invertase Pin-like site-specific DNA recombinase